MESSIISLLIIVYKDNLKIFNILPNPPTLHLPTEAYFFLSLEKVLKSNCDWPYTFGYGNPLKHN